MASGISFSGLSSGIDTDSVVSAMTQAETTRKSALQTKQNSLKLRQTAYATVKSGLTAVSRAAGALNSPNSFATIKAASGEDAVATISATSNAIPGTFDLDVTKLARANKAGTAPQADLTSALGKAGTASINGKAFDITADDSLTSIAKKINGLNAGATASVVNGGTGKAYLTFTSSTTGANGALSLADLNGSALGDLGVIGSGATQKDATKAFASKSDTLQSLLGATGLPASTISVNGASVSVDPATDTLDTLAGKINDAGGSASVEASTKDGATVYSLKVASGALGEGGGLLKGLGLLRATPGNEMVPAQDAEFTLDGVALTSPTNTVTSVIAGATLTLKKADSTSLTLTRDTAAIKTNVGNLVSSVNDMLASVKQLSSFDAKTYATGPLFGDSVASNAKDSVRRLLFTDAAGVTGTTKNLAAIGFGLDSDGNVELDDAKFDKALNDDPDGVAALFQATGKGTGSVKYVAATNAAKASSAAGYGVDVTQAATRGSLVAGTAQTGARTIAETLTFRGTGFGASGIAIDFAADSDLNATVAKINGDSRLKELVGASVENGKLRIDAKKYGTAGNFTLASNFASSGSNSGVGVGGEGTAAAGLDVAGTINGEAANGSGQFLTGKVGNAKTDGLQVQVTGSATGSVGTIGYSRGAASLMMDLVSGFTDATKGSLSTVDKGLQTQIDSLDKDMTTISDRITSKTAQLKARFAAMEDALAKLKSQSSTLASMLGTNSSSG